MNNLQKTERKADTGVKRPPKVSGEEPATVGEQLDKVGKFLRASGLGYNLDNDVVKTHPSPVTAKNPHPRPVYPAAPDYTNMDDAAKAEAFTKYSTDLNQFRLDLEGYDFSEKSIRYEYETYSKELAEYKEWRAEEDIAQSAFETFIPESRWNEIKGSVEYKEKPNLYTAFRVARKLMANLEGSGLQFHHWFARVFKTTISPKERHQTKAWRKFVGDWRKVIRNCSILDSRVKKGLGDVPDADKLASTFIGILVKELLQSQALLSLPDGSTSFGLR
ncbi:hypothetical protein BCR33DRAFT_65862 [Rhizoclosmatium globosum]|uniref:Uncharacterized protein n=1 Tax=Rhizoclosmatium globosum TaxID=329046 RepID=A0A1Y2ATR9_9FUNG|nr:hypothetical protein BCR33DRAFT_65862 [Rhizoclosmatium globosum]|eukprot:ORY25963.1 hypothetical protein BCR33DRAFT_65862 [Rhizoclosmatium globosum]